MDCLNTVLEIISISALLHVTFYVAYTEYVFAWQRDGCFSCWLAVRHTYVGPPEMSDRDRALEKNLMVALMFDHMTLQSNQLFPELWPTCE